jgi:hypothetical protein
MFDFAQSLQRNEKKKENLSRFPVRQFIDPFFRLSWPRLHFLTLATKNKTDKTFSPMLAAIDNSRQV